MNVFWTNFQKDWVTGSHTRDELYFNREAANPLALFGHYYDKALYLAGVESMDALHLETEDHLQPSDRIQTPVVWSKYHQGRVGYVGALGSTRVLLAMCGL